MKFKAKVKFWWGYIKCHNENPTRKTCSFFSSHPVLAYSHSLLGSATKRNKTVRGRVSKSLVQK